jgi:hypothetical protein
LERSRIVIAERFRLETPRRWMLEQRMPSGQRAVEVGL